MKDYLLYIALKNLLIIDWAITKLDAFNFDSELTAELKKQKYK
jgi:hypothetical protein